MTYPSSAVRRREAAALLGFSAALCGAGTRALPADDVSGRWHGVPVLMYHRIDTQVPGDPVGRDLTVVPSAFAAQLQYLRRHHLSTITAAELVSRLRAGERPRNVVVLTFDDGYADGATMALPLLREYGARGTFYVSSGFIGSPRHLTWRQLRELRAAGMEVACHGTFHLDLATLDRAGQEREAGGCMRRFAKYLGPPAPVTYAYPAGKYDATSFLVLAHLGVRAAFTEDPGDVESLQKPYALPRERVGHDDPLVRFATIVNQ